MWVVHTPMPLLFALKTSPFQKMWVIVSAAGGTAAHHAPEALWEPACAGWTGEPCAPKRPRRMMQLEARIIEDAVQESPGWEWGRGFTPKIRRGEGRSLPLWRFSYPFVVNSKKDSCSGLTNTPRRRVTAV